MEHVDTYPQLAEIDADNMKRDDMIKKAEIIFAQASTSSSEMSDEDKIEAFKKALEENPETVLVLRGQALLRLPHPKVRGKTFELNVFSDQGPMGSSLIEPHRLRREHTPETRNQPPGVVTPSATRLGEVPKWAIPQIFDLVQEGQIAVKSDASEITKNAGMFGKEILDDNTAPIRMQYEYRDVPGRGDNKPFTLEPRGEFKRPEQKAAWNVLNSTVRGQEPLPSGRDAVSPDPNTITEEERQHVRSRIKECLTNPREYAESQNTNPKTFDKKTFFNQLLKCEYKGFTPRRHGNGAKTGGTRKAIIQEIRSAAKAEGFEVLGDFVREKGDDSPKKDIMPTGTFDRNTPVTW